MMRRMIAALSLAALLWLPGGAKAQGWDYGRMHYYPYYYFPHNYWPQMSPQWPERPGEPYQKAPAYMAYPAFHEPHWRYELHKPMPYYRGFHFWLDQF
ncbi:MAG: hypothetical protein K2W96_13765 [Gemmataceae bacterium]|nr:hypothetical protein [Gemmataceae bacterium]